MTSADVVPSLRRWGRVASVGRTRWKYVEAVEAKDPYTVVISMKQPSELQVEVDVKKRKAIIDRLQTAFYEDVGQVKLGDYFTLDVARRDLRGEFRPAPRMYFWNSWLAR